ncbi:MAG: hypothetical protein ACPKOI_09090 [Pleomorphochaeta sp.]
MKKNIIFLILLLFFSNLLFAQEYNIERNYESNSFRDEVERLISKNLDSTLVAYTKVDEDFKNSLIIKLNEISYENDLLIINGELGLNDKVLALDIKFNESDIKVLFNKLDSILYNSFNYDLNLLFEDNDSYHLSYTNKVNSFLNIEDKYRSGDFVLLKTYDDNKSLAVVNSIYDNYATIDYLNNPINLINTQILDGPKSQIGINYSFDFINNMMNLSSDYFYLKGLFTPFDKAYLGISGSYYLNLTDYSYNFSSDLGLFIELPLSKVFGINSFLKNFSVYNKTKIGVVYENPIALHSIFEVGLTAYLSTSTKIGVAYKMDSYNESYYNALISFDLLF